jgi:hypothetical protein
MAAKGADSPDSPNSLQHHDLLVTAQLNILNNRARPIQDRALVDIGSSMNFMTEKFESSLDIKQSRCSVQIGALDSSNNFSQRFTQIKTHANQNSRSYQNKKSTSNTDEYQRRFENLRGGQSSQLILRYLLYGTYTRHFLLVA